MGAATTFADMSLLGYGAPDPLVSPAAREWRES